MVVVVVVVVVLVAAVVAEMLLPLPSARVSQRSIQVLRRLQVRGFDLLLFLSVYVMF